MKGDEGLSEGSLFPTLALVSPILVLSKPYDQGKFVVKLFAFCHNTLSRQYSFHGFRIYFASLSIISRQALVIRTLFHSPILAFLKVY